MFSKVKVSSSSEIVALKIRQAVVNGKYSKGSKLPPERELAAQFGVGRSTIREALKTLKAMGLITVKTGSRGGAFVQDADVESMAEAIQLMLELKITHWKEVLEVRSAIEPFTNKLAAQNRSADDVDELMQLLYNSQKVLQNYEEYITYNTNFHLKLAECSRNNLLYSLLTTASELIARSGHEVMKDYETRQLAHKEHLRLIAAIREQDGKQAFRLTELHLIHAEEQYRGILDKEYKLQEFCRDYDSF